MQNPYPGDDRPVSKEELALIGLIRQFMDLSDDDENAGRVIFRGPRGEYVGEVKLSPRDVAAATEALACLIAARNAMRAELGEDNPAPALAPQPAADPLPAPTVTVDPYLEAELEEYCIGLDTEHLMQVAAHNPAEAVAEFDQITSDTDGDGLL